MVHINTVVMLDILREVGALTMRYARGGDLHHQLKIWRKEDGSKVSTADIEAHKLITRRLHEYNPDIPAQSEEGTPEEKAAAMRSPIRWSIDSINHTTNFLAHQPHFENQFALVENGVATQGFIIQPALDMIYYTKDGQAFAQHKKKPPHIVQAETDFTDTLRASFKRHVKFETPINGYTLIPTYDSGFESLLNVALGRAHVGVITPHGQGNYRHWDVAPLDAFAGAAGVICVDKNGQRLTYNNPDFVVPHAMAGHPNVLNRLGVTREFV